MLDLLAEMGDLDKMPAMLKEAFPGPLSFQEERMLIALDQELAMQVGMMLDSALDREVLIQISEQEQKMIREANAIRKALREILKQKGMASELRMSLN